MHKKGDYLKLFFPPFCGPTILQDSCKEHPRRVLDVLVFLVTLHLWGHLKTERFKATLLVTEFQAKKQRFPANLLHVFLVIFRPFPFQVSTHKKAMFLDDTSS